MARASSRLALPGWDHVVERAHSKETGLGGTLGIQFTGSALAAAMGIALHAQAQTIARTEDGDVQREQVVVTAQKRRERLQDVPISLTLLSGDALDKSRVRTLQELSQSIPNFEVAPVPGVATIVVRGIGGGGRNIGFDTRVGVYLDGIYVGQSQALGLPLFDIEQVEVLRGPQGHLFGRNTVAGAVNIITRTASKEFEGSMSAGTGNLGAREVYGIMSGPIGPWLQGKLSVSTEARRGYTSNLFDGGRLDNLDRLASRGQIRFQPTDALSFDLFGDYSNTKQNAIIGEATTGFFDQPLPDGPLPPRVVNFNTQPHLNAKLSGMSLTTNFALGGGHSLTAVTGYRLTRQDRGNDTDYNPQDIFKIRYRDDFRQYSQEVRVVSRSTGAFRYVGGVYFLKETAETLRTASTGVDASLLGLPLDLVATNAGTVRTGHAALFGSLDLGLVTDITLNLGARYTRERKDLLYNVNGAAAAGFATLVDYRDGRAERKLDPTVGMTFAVAHDLAAYGKYAAGFKSGGWNADFVTDAQVAAGLDFKPETVKSFEMGLKGALLGGRVQYELAAFDSRYDNYQTFFFVPAPNGTAILQLKNAAKVDSSGLEASTRVRLNSSLKLVASMGLVRATYRSFPNGGGLGVDLSGQRVPDTPKMRMSLNLDYTTAVTALNGSLALFAEFNHRDSTRQDSNLPSLASRDLVNARATFAANSLKWEASVWARNLMDKAYVIATARDFLGNNIVTRGVPRTFGVEAKYHF